MSEANENDSVKGSPTEIESCAMPLTATFDTSECMGGVERELTYRTGGAAAFLNLVGLPKSIALSANASSRTICSGFSARAFVSCR